MTQPHHAVRHSTDLLPISTKLWIYTNYDCNLHCSYCVAESHPKALQRAMPLSTVKKIIDEALELGFKSIYFTGGEPFILDDIYAMLAYASAKLPTTVLSNAMLKLEAGDSIWIKQQANGFFTLGEVPDAKTLWLLGTGTGVAPFFSILNTDEPWQRFEHIVLVHAVRTVADLRYQEIVQSLLKKYGERFRFQAFISREERPGTIHGRIPAAIENGELEKSVDLKLALEDSQIMLCGNPDMVKDSIECLKARGFSKNRRRTPGQITAENYW